MLFHASIAAHRPEPVARLIADLWRGEAHPFPPVTRAWIALAGDDRGTAIEVLPFGTEMRPGATEADFAAARDAGEYSAGHQAIGSPLGVAAILARAEAAGWQARVCDRGPFAVVEVWLENRLLIEVLTPEMQATYRAFLTPGHWRAFVIDSAEGNA